MIWFVFLSRFILREGKEKKTTRCYVHICEKGGKYNFWGAMHLLPNTGNRSQFCIYTVGDGLRASLLAGS
jgi:hypothetical protein